ncbi:cytochrome P450 monooxygenase [Laetiporus sulphureus 93-53]|uniref:Cytochrome P450 monooxygenase n=1 Tax=Laetiporus sulphureus 93-53 TaxID=1314785 RepID=A0A165CUH5_9APHY|nr:cytochrome P450 monooxygenase [Laetiporus sulphureus 93-53]KZT03453.1 cytochrome P450 monooxygenase [Laetiporus sulphureus 93-53]
MPVDFSSAASIATIILIFSLQLLCSRMFYATRHVKLPPGPRPLPLLGNILRLPHDFQEKTFAQWGAQYGDLVYAWFFRTPALVINSLEAAQDLMERRSANYSDRPRFVYMGELMGWKAIFTLMSTDTHFRRHRKWMQNAFQDKAALFRYRPVQQREVFVLLAGLLAAPERYSAQFRRFAAATIVEIAYGHTVKSDDDEYVRMAERALIEVTTHGSPGGTLLDLLPALKYWPSRLPGGSMKRRAINASKLVSEMLDAPFAMVKQAMASGTASPSFASNLLQEVSSERPLTKQDDEDIKGVTGVLYGAAVDTTAASLEVFLLAMVLNPAVYKKAQAEIDRIVGKERLPEFDDRPSLPYIECLIKETYRWHTVVPLGLPHKSISRDSYRGYDIMAGSTIIPNIWAISRDPTMYPEPDTFRPERFEEDGVVNPWKFVFGFGRRICPGRYIADRSVWLAIANIVAAFDIIKVQDNKGLDVVPRRAFTSGFTSHPVDFQCTIKPRTDKVRSLIAQMSEGLSV